MAWLAATAARADVPHALAAWTAGDYGAAFVQASEAAEDGDADAQFLLGEAYRLGNGVAPDLLSAEVWYFRAARRGHVAAAAELGTLYAGEHREADAGRWLAFAAEHGDAGAQGALAALAFNQATDRSEVARAVTLMTRAAAAGSIQAARSLARMRQAEDPSATVAPAPPSAVATPPEPLRAAAVASSLAPVAARAWRVQVGAFRNRAAARRAWTLLRRRVAAVRGTTRIFSPAGSLVRVQAIVASAADARMLCRALHAARWACFVRAPRTLRIATLAVRHAAPGTSPVRRD